MRQQIYRINGKVVARDLKTKNSRRVLPITTKVRDALLEHADKNSVTLPPFDPYCKLSTEGTVAINSAGKRIQPSSLKWCFNNLTKKAGLPHITIHAMRHTAATILKDLNVPVKDVQMILGHSNITTTLNIYQHGTPENYGAAITSVEQRLLSA